MAKGVLLPCWICGADADSGEHKVKASDLRSVFGNVTPEAPLYLHDSKRRNRRIQSVKSDILKLRGVICHECNTTRTQPYDRAWEHMSVYLRNRQPAIRVGCVVNTKEVFPKRRRLEMRNVHLYFVKFLGCYISANFLPIDLSSFREAIMKDWANPFVYMQFGCNPSHTGFEIVRMSDISIATRTSDGTGVAGGLIYYVGHVGVLVFFAAAGESRQGQRDGWHPRYRRDTITFCNLE